MACKACITTYTGKQFDLLKPRPEDVSIIDVAVKRGDL